MRTLYPFIALVPVALFACDPGPPSASSASTTAITAAAPTTTGASTTKPNSTPASTPTGNASGTPVAATTGFTIGQIAAVNNRGCTLVSADDKNVYARVGEHNEILVVNRSTGQTEIKPLSTHTYLQTVVNGAAYGCSPAESQCSLIRIPLDGGERKRIGNYAAIVDNRNTALGTKLAAVFAPIGQDGYPDLTVGRFTVETVDLVSAERSLVFGPTGTGSAALTPKGVLFNGALVPKENIASESWGLWHLNSKKPQKIPVTEQVRAMTGDETHVYFIGDYTRVRRIAWEGSTVEPVTEPLPEPPLEERKERMRPALVAVDKHLYASTSSAGTCWIWEITQP
ncbi:MAG: hypothetical protein IPK82_42185 [Polyangiaceae bacterium]|nr:hypothetical protein [Polyangiaceae bacterium]